VSRIEARFRGTLGAFALDAEFDMPGRGVTALFGPSGSGKTSLLRLVAGLARTPGRLVVNGEVWQDEKRFVPTHRRALGYVFQVTPACFPTCPCAAILNTGGSECRRVCAR